MKKPLVFILGIIVGIILSISINLIVSKITREKQSDIQIFKKAGQVFNVKVLHVFQALEPGYGLAYEEDGKLDICYLLWMQDGTSLYDDQIVKIPSGQCLRHVGIYKYKTNSRIKTVPVVTMMKKQ